MEEKTYTQEEINSNINTLETEMDLQKSQRTELSKSINDKKKQILAWKEFDLAQFKMF